MFSIDKISKKYYNNTTHLPINTTGVPSDRQRFRVGQGVYANKIHREEQK